MTRTTLNFVIDLISAVVGLGLILTGLIMYFALPPGSRQAALWGVGRHDWGAVHSWMALAVVCADAGASDAPLALGMHLRPSCRNAQFLRTLTSRLATYMASRF